MTVLMSLKNFSFKIAQEQPLVGKKIELSNLLSEYHVDDDIYRKKITDLCTTYKHLRKTRGDGNCFFRAFGFRYLETLMGKADKLEK